MESSSSSSPISTPTTLPMAPPAGQLSALSKMQQEPPAAPEGLPIEAASNKSSSLVSSSSPSRAIAIPPPSRDSIYLRRDKDFTRVDSIPPRTDSIDSYASYATSFRSRRTDTTWSVFTQGTDITEQSEPPSPVAADFHDEPVNFDELDASSARPLGGRLQRTVTFNDNCPDNAPLPKPGFRLHNRPASPRGILRSSTGFNPTRPSSTPRRGSNQWPGPLTHRPRISSRFTIEESDHRPSPLQDTLELPTPVEPTPAEQPESEMLRQIRQDDVQDVGMSSLSVEDAKANEPAPEEMSDSSDSVGDIATPSSSSSGSRPDDQTVHDTCDHLLRNVFGVDLQELGVTGAASAAYDSVHYCLDELSHLVPAESSVSQSSPPVHQLGGYEASRSGGPTPILPGGVFGGFQTGGGNGSGSGGQKRRNGDGDEGDQPGQNGNGGGKRPGDRDNGGGGKRAKVAATEGEDQKLSCPFRKRNPVKFNVRDHQSCAVQSFPDISQLKRHVKNFHKQRSVSMFACPRCKKDMVDKETLEHHLKVPNAIICTPEDVPAAQNPEDGITSRIEDVLNGRKANTKVDTWEVLWPTLFPGDQVIPEPHFVPPVELEEVHCQFQTHFDDLETRIREMEQNATDFGQSFEDRVARIVESCTAHIEYVMELSRLQADNAPGRPRRIRSNNGQNPKSKSKGKSPETHSPGGPSGKTASPVSREHSGQLLVPPEEATQPQAIPKQRQRQPPSRNESNLSSSLDTSNSDDSWVHAPQPGGQDVITTMAPAPDFDYSTGLNINTIDVTHTEIDDSQLSAITAGTGPAGSPAHYVSPLIGHGDGGMIPPPQQVHLRDSIENVFQVGPNGSQSQTMMPVTQALASQLHARTDSGISGFDSTPGPATYMRSNPNPTYQNPNNNNNNSNNNNMGMFAAPAAPNTFQHQVQGMPAAMGYGQPTAQPGQMHPQQMQRLQQLQQLQQVQQVQQVQMRFRQPQQQHQQQVQQHVPVSMSGGTIDPSMIFGMMGNNGGNNGHGYHPFPPGGGDGTN